MVIIIKLASFFGDGLTLIAGVLKVPLYEFIVLITIAKVLRYVFVALMAMSIFN